MPIEPILAVALFALLANLVLIAVTPGGPRGRMRGRIGRLRHVMPGDAPAVGDPGPSSRGSIPVSGGRGGHTDGPPDEPVPDAELHPAALDRVLRVGTWVFLFAATTIVAVTDLWAAHEALILAALAAAGLYTLVLHELLPARIPSAVVLAAEAALGLVFAGILISLTGGAVSPFALVLPLIVAGVAMVVSPGVTLALTAGAGVAYLVAIAVGGPAPLPPLAVATAGVNLAVLCLAAYIGMAVGREQRRVRDEVLQAATMDPLTGLRTRSYLFTALERELLRSERTGRGFCLLMADLDGLKLLNDTHGHLVGDRVLRTVGDVIRAGTRRLDTGARFGGDEFVVLLPETDPTGAWVLAEKIRRGVAEAGLLAGGKPVATSVSVGIATYPHDGRTIVELLVHADDEMYRLKHTDAGSPPPAPAATDDAAVSTMAAAGERGDPV